MNNTQLIESIFLVISTIVPLIITIAFFTLAERKVMAAIQRRVGPNMVGFWGLLQPFADGIKLVLKEIVIPSKANFFIFIASPVLTFILSLIGWAVIPFSFKLVFADINLGIFYLFAVSALGIYGIVLAG
jgi:NADH-quinone oxidoreductase subunit H